MLKAILYYILLIAEFIVTLFVGGIALSFYIMYKSTKGGIANEAAFLNNASPIFIFFSLLSMVIVWVTFYKAKFSKFTLGKVLPAVKWKAMLYTSLPLFGFTLAYYAALNLLQIHFLPKEMNELGYLAFVPYAVVGSFFSAYVFYGAIQEELIRCGKKKWIQLLTLCLMMFPLCLLIISEENNLRWEYLTLLGLISTCYGFWIYGKTRSSILLFAIYFVSNLVPTQIKSESLAIFLIVIGLAITVWGYVNLRKKMPLVLTNEEEA